MKKRRIWHIRRISRKIHENRKEKRSISSFDTLMDNGYAKILNQPFYRLAIYGY